MAQECKYLTVVHLQIDAIDCFEAIVVHFGQVTDLQELVLKLKSGNFGCNRLVVFALQIFKFERIDKRLPSITFLKGASSLNGFLVKLSLVNVCVSAVVLAHAAEEHW